MAPAYPFGTLLSSTSQMFILWYSTIFYWRPSYPCGTLLSSTIPLSIPMVFYYLSMAPVYPLSTLLPFTGPMPVLWYSTIFYWLPSYPCGTLLSSTVPLPIPMELYCLMAPAYPLGCLLLAQCLYYGSLLSSTGSLLIHMVLFNLLLVPCLSLWYYTIFYCIPFYT